MVLRPRAEAPDWLGGGNPDRAGKCTRFTVSRDHDPWFDPDLEADAMDICNGWSDGIVCPMRQACLEWSLINNEKHGVWGGMLPHDRLAMRIGRREDPYYPWDWHPPTPYDGTDIDAFDEDEEDDEYEIFEEFEDEVTCPGEAESY